MTIYKEKSVDYYTSVRQDLIKLIPRSENQKILEIGCGGGDTLIEIKKNRIAKEVVGVDINFLEESNQQNSLIDKILIGNIEQLELDYPEQYFDVIICGDVIEHLIDPWSLIIKLTKHLKNEGIWIISIPNVREIFTLYKIVIRGNFKYNEGGILDRTHLRFFCKQNIIELFSTPHLKISKIFTNLDLFEKFSLRRMINKITFRIFEQFLTARYILIVKKILN
jgi:2-polyprenyl-3-methyl-5-hydroxy-6-metoxy-1,4-benzoquinol methylase